MKCISNNFTLLIITIIIQYSLSAKILGIFPIPSISHQVVYRALCLELSKRGHDVTIVTPNPIETKELPQINYRQIDVQNVSYAIWNEIFNFAQMRKQSENSRAIYPIFKEIIIDVLETQLSTPDFKNLLDDPSQKFDLLLLESLVIPAFGFSWKYKIPYIGVSLLSGIISNFDAVGSPTHCVLYPDIFREQSNPLDIWGKLGALHNELFIRYIDYKMRDKEHSFVKKYFGDDAPPPYVLENNMDMLFINIHPILGGIRPSVPAIVYMGGSHIKSRKPLPKNLQTFLDNSSQGVVYMSLGSNVKSKDLPLGTLKMILKVFEELPYNVIWKYEEDLPNVPKNVKTYKWLPQTDLLGHPNLKVFITQGGQQSMEEAIQAEVPLIGIPFMGDQDLNVRNFVKFGIGIGLDINTLRKEDLKQAIMSVTKDIMYKKNIKKLSKLLTDQPMTGVERGVWWAEYVIRHGGAKHLRSPSADVTVIEYLMLDVITLICTVLLVVLSMVVAVFKCFWKLLLKRKLKLS